MQDNIDVTDYLFDLNGFVILRNAVEPELIARINAVYDRIPPGLAQGEWWGKTQRFDNNGLCGLELQNIAEAGEPFETLIDHPAWIERMRRYCGEQGTYVEGLFIDECFASIRREGGFFPMHSGGQEGIVRNQFRVVRGKFRCAQVNVLLALNDIGPGDSGTSVIPGSHKANFAHPHFGQDSRDGKYIPIEGAIEVNLKAGDALMFVDAVCHGSTPRLNPGERRVVIYRYGPSWGATRHGYQYSQELLDRLTPERRKILQPITPRLPA